MIRLGVSSLETIGGTNRRACYKMRSHILKTPAVERSIFYSYPGPISYDVRYEVLGPLQEACVRYKVAVAAGTSTPLPGKAAACHVTHVLIDATGSVKGQYHRTHPRSEVYRGLYGSGGCAKFEYTAADALPIFDMGWGIVGISICSEMFVPEVARALAIQGAEICLMPVGWTIDDLGWRDIWQTLVRARAIENIMFTAACQNLIRSGDAQALRRAGHPGGG